MSLTTSSLSRAKEDLANEMKAIAQLANISFVRQKLPLGLGHAVYCAKTFAGRDPIAVLLGDDIVYNPERPAISPADGRI